MSKANLKPIVSKLRESIIKGIAGKLEKYGFDNEGKLSVQKPLSQYDENIRDNICAYFEAERICNEDKYIDYIHNTSRTFLHILVCFKLMEKRGIMSSLLDKVIGINIYEEIIPDFISVNPMAYDEFGSKYEEEIDVLASRDNNEEDKDYYQILLLIKKLTKEMSKEIPLLFKEYEFCLVQPEFDDLKQVLLILSDISKDEFMESDFLGWIYQYWVDAGKAELSIARKEKDISTANYLYWKILDGLETEQSQFGEFYTPREVVMQIIEKTLIPVSNIKDIEEIKIIDPACGAGNFLVAATSVMMNLYHEQRPNWDDERIISTILEKNIYGVDVQREPLQIAAINLWIMARSIVKEVKLRSLNLLNVNVLKANSLYRFELEPEYVQLSLFDSINMEIGNKYTSEDIGNMISNRENVMKRSAQSVFKNKFDVIIMNPPYLGIRKMKPELSRFLKDNYPKNYNNLFEAFVARALELLSKDGMCGLVGTDTFLTLESHKNIRAQLLKETVINEINKVGNVFDGPTVNAVIMVFTKKKPQKTTEVLVTDNAGTRHILQKDFLKIKDAPFTFGFDENFFKMFDKEKPFKEVAEIKQGIMTGDNQKFLRKKWQIRKEDIGIKFFPFAKGGGFSKYANDMYDYLYYENDGELIKREAKKKYGSETRTIKNQEYFYRGGITYSHITSNNRFSARIYPEGCIFGNAGPCIFVDQLSVDYLLGFTNSKLFNYIVLQLNPTANYEIGDIERVPVMLPDLVRMENVERNVRRIQKMKEFLLGFSYTSDFYHDVELEFGFKEGAESIHEAYDRYYMRYEQTLKEMHEVQREIDSEFYQIYNLNEAEIELIENEFSDSPFQDSVMISIEEATINWIRAITKSLMLEKEPKLYTPGELEEIIQGEIETKFSDKGYLICEEIEHILRAKIREFIVNGVRVDNKKIYLHGDSINDEKEPYIQVKVLAGKGKKREIILWNLSQFLLEYDDNKKYVLQNEIRRLVNEVYIPKFQRSKEEGTDGIEILEESIKTLENWKVVD